MIGRLLKPMAATTTRNPAKWLVDYIGGGDSEAGISISPGSSINYSAFYACVVVISESIASLPFVVYRRLRDGGKERAPDHVAYGLLHNAPNAWMTAFAFFQTCQAHILTWGNAYAEISGPDLGRPSLIIHHPQFVTPRASDEGRLYYEVRLPSSDPRDITADKMIHVAGLTGEGVVGYSPLRMHREAVGLGLAAERFGARWFGNGSRPSGILVHPQRMQREHREAFRAEWERNMGAENQNKIAILEEGFTWQQLSVPPEEAQFLETRKFQVSEMARIHRIPPHLIGDLEHATFSNIEHQGIEFVTHCLRPWLVRWEQEINRKLLSGDPDLFGEFLVDALLRGDLVARMQAYSTGLQNGIYSANEVRNFENLNPYDGGDEFLSPLNMVPANTRGGDTALAHHADRVMSQAESRLLRKENRAVKAAAVKCLRNGRTGFAEWLDEFYGSFTTEAIEVLEPIVDLRNALDCGGHSAYSIVTARCRSAKQEILTASREADPEASVLRVLERRSDEKWLHDTATS